MKSITIGVMVFTIGMVISDGGLAYNTWQYWVTMALCAGIVLVASLRG